MKRVGTFLILVALVAGMNGCFTPFRTYCQLTVSGTEGGKVVAPGEGIFNYWQGTTVSLVAEAEEGYSFIYWTGEPCTCNIANIYAASTSITMNSDYSIVAHFEALFAGGNGTEEYPYQIANWHQLHNVRDYLDKHFVLMSDLDSATTGYEELAGPTANSGKGWQPIGDLVDRFTGSLDGQGYEIKDLFINRPSELSVGLFGCANGTVKNVGLVNANVTGERPVGIMVGINDGTVSNSYSIGSVRGDWLVGGLVGHNEEEGTVSNSYATGNVTGNSSVGGLVGWNVGTMSNSYSMGNVTGNSSAGGLVGHNSAAVNSSYATGSVVGSYYVGGLVGENYIFGTVSNSYSTGSVTGDQYVGGLVGDNGLFGTVANSFWDTETSGQSTSAGGTGKNTTEMQDIVTFSGATWDITAVANSSARNLSYIWNIVNNVTYPFLSWQPVS